MKVIDKNNISVTDKAKRLIELESKTWLAEKLGITRVTLDTRLEKGNWKRSENQMLLTLSR